MKSNLDDARQELQTPFSLEPPFPSHPMMVYLPDGTAAYMQQQPPFPRISPLSMPSPDAITNLIAGVCNATGMTPMMLYSCLGASLGNYISSDQYPKPPCAAPEGHVYPSVVPTATSQSDAMSAHIQGCSVHQLSESVSNECLSPGSDLTGLDLSQPPPVGVLAPVGDVETVTDWQLNLVDDGAPSPNDGSCRECGQEGDTWGGLDGHLSENMAGCQCDGMRKSESVIWSSEAVLTEESFEDIPEVAPGSESAPQFSLFEREGLTQQMEFIDSLPDITEGDVNLEIDSLPGVPPVSTFQEDSHAAPSSRKTKRKPREKKNAHSAAKKPRKSKRADDEAVLGTTSQAGTPGSQDSCPARPEIELVLRNAHLNGKMHSGERKSPEEILREAFQATMAAKGKGADSHSTKKGPCTQPQALAARARRERVNMRMKAFQNLIPGAQHLTTENFLIEAMDYISALLNQIKELSSENCLEGEELRICLVSKAEVESIFAKDDSLPVVNSSLSPACGSDGFYDDDFLDDL